MNPKQYSYCLLAFEAVVTCAIVYFVAYTEIDYAAYMQECFGFLSGELDYRKLRGDTGPLVYPAGFVYIYSALYYITDLGRDIFTAQVIFVVLYLAFAATVFAIYVRARTPMFLMTALVLSKRIHSIFVLRLFNDCVAMWFFYIAVLLFMSQRWKLGCVLYSLAVSVKMNIFLFAPALLFALCQRFSFVGVVGHLAICAVVQLVLGAPFLLHNWQSYIGKAFELSRVFTYKWAVNFRFLPEEVFVSPVLGYALLLATVVAWVALWRLRWRHRDVANSGRELVATLFESNMVGIIFSRSLHYQFYVWFFHTLPFLLCFSCGRIPKVLRIVVLVAVEVAFNVYPSTAWSSGILVASFLLMWWAMLVSKDKKQTAVAKKKAAKKTN